MRNKVVNKKFAEGKKDYLKIIKTIEAEGKCPFCQDNFKYHKNEILKKRRDWFITKNSWPYKNSRYHFLIIGLKHKESLTELNENDFKSVKELANWAIKKFKIKGGALTIRFGDTNLSGSTVYHIHFHLISPKQKNNGIAKTVNFPIG
ncbi:MAG: HIT domain-containing protein [bacterium]|nr:HIT domain-containing protein [bacterium]